jgi:hypothetical protein
MSEEPNVEPDNAATEPIPVAKPLPSEPIPPDEPAPVAAPTPVPAPTPAVAASRAAESTAPVGPAAPAGAVTPAEAVAPIASPQRVAIAHGPWWHYLVVGLIGLVLGALICGGLLGISDHFRHDRFGDDRGRVVRIHRMPIPPARVGPRLVPNRPTWAPTPPAIPRPVPPMPQASPTA